MTAFYNVLVLLFACFGVGIFFYLWNSKNRRGDALIWSGNDNSCCTVAMSLTATLTSSYIWGEWKLIIVMINIEVMLTVLLTCSVKSSSFNYVVSC